MLTDVKIPARPSLLPNHVLGVVWAVLKSALQSPTQDATTQSDTSFFQQCDCCNVTFALDGDESLAGACGFCQRRICYMCSASLAWDESIAKLVNIYENCREEYLVAGFSRKFVICKLCEKGAPHV